MSRAGAHPREGQTLSGGSALVRWANFVKLPHTVFALPFALVGVIVASYRAPVTWPMVGWVVLAFTAARFAAMGFNRVVDREFDARNPRTAMREIPAGTISVAGARAAVAASVAVFAVAAWRLNPLCLALTPVAIAWVFFYSYTKRFTAWSHLVLGIGLGIAPVGGYLAVTGVWATPWWSLVALALAVATWVAGFDVLYALQDVEFDRREGLRSMPAEVGVARALDISRLLHAGAVGLLAAAGAVLHPGAAWTAGVIVVAGALAWEHWLIRTGDLSKLNAAFFTMNGVMSIAFCAVLVVERVLA